MSEENEFNIENQELEDIFNKLMEDHNIEELIGFSELDISEKLQRNDMLIVKYKELYYKELNTLEILERKMDALKGLRFKHYKFNDDHEWKPNEIEKYCFPSDEKIIKMKKIIAKQKVKTRFFEMCWRAFDKQGWSMKTFNDREIRGL